MNKKEFFNSKSNTVKVLKGSKNIVGKIGTVVHVSRWYAVVRVVGMYNPKSYYGDFCVKWENLESLPLTLKQY